MDSRPVACPTCQTLNPAGQKFCGECAAPLPRVCPSCGAPVTATQKFCGECAAPLGPGASSSSSRAEPAGRVTAGSSIEERRLVTALFCDLVGFTPLAESLDPEDTRQIQAEYFAAMSAQIERYEGTVEKYAGDAVLALFGAPIAHEDDAERAVLCALAMQASIGPVAATVRDRWRADLAVRVGVNTGDVVSGTWSASGRQDVAVTGDAVNTAARIQAVAEPGEVLVGAETMRLTRRRIRYGDQREIPLKGKSSAVDVYPALSLRERVEERWETGRHVAPLIGRDREMSQLLEAWKRAQGGEGQLVTVVGDAGVGKSRLIAELIERIMPHTGSRVVRARCLSYGQSISLWLVADLLRSLLGIAETTSSEEVAERLDTTLPDLLNHCGAETQEEARDVLGELLGLPAGTSGVGRAGPEIRREALIRSLRLLLAEVAQATPTLLLLEDLHWMDAAGQDVMTQILTDVPGLPLLILVSHRPGWNPPWGEWGWTERITLRPLPDADAAVLANELLGGTYLSARLQRYVADRAGGNPFFVEEMLRTLEESGGLTKQGGVADLAPGGIDRLPSTLTEILLARLDRLDGQARSVAQVGSVIGRTFAVRLLSRVMEQESAVLEPALSALQHAEIAFPRRAGDLEYSFKHVTLREVAYGTLVQKRRQLLHVQTARAIAVLYPSDEYVEMIAYHYGRTDAPEAAGWLERAGDHAASVYATENALSDYREAVRRLRTMDAGPEAIARVEEKLGATLYTAGQYDEALEVLGRVAEAHQQRQDLEAAGRVTARMGMVHRFHGTPEVGISLVQPMIDMLEPSAPSPALVSLYIALARLRFLTGLYKEGLPAAERAAELAQSLGDEGLLGEAESARGLALTNLGEASQALPVLRAALPLVEATGDLTNLYVLLNNIGYIRLNIGPLEEACRYRERALDVAERIGNPYNVCFMLGTLGDALLVLGDWRRARGYLERGVAQANGLSRYGNVAVVPLILGKLHLWMGEQEAASQRLQEAVTIAAEAKDRQHGDRAKVLLAELDMVRGKPSAAVTRLEPLLDSQTGILSSIQAALAWAFLELGHQERARKLALESVQEARRSGELLVLVDGLRILGMTLMRQEQGREATTVFEEGLAAARALPYPYAEARILQQMGHRDEALAVFGRLGAGKNMERLSVTVNTEPACG